MPRYVASVAYVIDVVNESVVETAVSPDPITVDTLG